jgi:cytochrome c
MKCNQCGTENRLGANFCKGCGNKMEAALGLVDCPKCGQTIESGKKFCPKCGASLVTAAPIAVAPIAAPPPPPATAAADPATEPPVAASGAADTVLASSAPTASPAATSEPPSPPDRASPFLDNAAIQPLPDKKGTSNVALAAVIATILLAAAAGGGYWYYQKQETEKAIALKIQQEREIRLKAEADAKAAEARQLAEQVARLNAEKKAAESRQLAEQAARLNADRKAQEDQQRLQAQRQQPAPVASVQDRVNYCANAAGARRGDERQAFLQLCIRATQPGVYQTSLATKNNCLKCHAVDRRTVGPSFKEIGARYRGDPGAADRLVARVRRGSAGSWGNVPEPPQTNVSSADLVTIVTWILAM